MLDSEAQPRFVRSCHPAAFRSGRWGEIIAEYVPDDGRGQWLVRFADGVTDTWLVDDPPAEYEFRSSLPWHERAA